jgi:hypothetical protein
MRNVYNTTTAIVTIITNNKENHIVQSLGLSQRAIHSISKRAPLGNPATATVERAGGSLGKSTHPYTHTPYNSFTYEIVPISFVVVYFSILEKE